MRRLLLFPVLILTVLALAVSPAAAGKGGKGGGGNGGGGSGGGGGEPTLPTAVVSLGDSYISGEGGRWQGNWATSGGSRGDTDRAAYKRKGVWYYDGSRVYGSTDSSGCHRSDVAEINSAAIAVTNTYNIACSGAVSANIYRGSNGGQWFKGEAPQADQLAGIAAANDVELIVLSIGGNDLGFADIIIDCAVGYNTSPSWWQNTCNDQQSNVDNDMPGAMNGVGKAIDEIRAVMDAAGQAAGTYRLVVQSYPSPIPRASEFRYSESGWDRSNTGGCPFWNVDANWARDSLVPQISDNIKAVAEGRGAEFLDLSDALDGREVCSTSAAQGSGADAEWARFLVTGLTQGEAQESMHPNALGQQAIGTCLAQQFAAAPGSYKCTNIAGLGPSSMNLAAS